MFSLNVESKFDNNNNSDKPKVSYQNPGIYENVKIVEIVFGKSSIKQTPFIQLITSGTNGEIGKSSRMYLSSTASEGKEQTAWTVTASTLMRIIGATNNMTQDELKNIEFAPNVSDPEEAYKILIQKLSTYLIGKPFRAKFKGEQTKENGLVYAVLNSTESMLIPKENSRLKYDAASDIKYFTGAVANTQPSSSTNF